MLEYDGAVKIGFISRYDDLVRWFFHVFPDYARQCSFVIVETPDDDKLYLWHEEAEKIPKDALDYAFCASDRIEIPSDKLIVPFVGRSVSWFIRHMSPGDILIGDISRADIERVWKLGGRFFRLQFHKFPGYDDVDLHKMFECDASIEEVKP